MIARQNADLKESVMLMAGNNISEFEKIMELSIEDYLIRFKLHIDQLISRETKE